MFIYVFAVVLTSVAGLAMSCAADGSIIELMDIKTSVNISDFKQWSLPCIEDLRICNEDKDCLVCFDPFIPRFSLQSIETCEGFAEAFDKSCSAQCDTDSKPLKSLRNCIADNWFFVLTLGSVEHFCSVNETTIYADEW